MIYNTTVINSFEQLIVLKDMKATLEYTDIDMVDKHFKSKNVILKADEIYDVIYNENVEYFEAPAPYDEGEYRIIFDTIKYKSKNKAKKITCEVAAEINLNLYKEGIDYKINSSDSPSRINYIANEK